VTVGTTAPDGQAILHIDDARCHICRRCLAQIVCRVRAIVRIDADEAPVIDVHRCRGCKVCTLECPYDAIAET
jgi:MinD superfamily P-loop ATPase